MDKSEKEQAVAELTERLRTSETLIVADYRGLTNAEIDGLRSKLIEHGARFSVVKNTLTRRAAEAAGADALLALLEGPSAIAFVESGGDPVAVAKALADTARETKILSIRGGVLQGASMTAEQVESLAKLPPADVLRAQLLATIMSPLTTVVALVSAPLRDLVGLIDARIEQLGGADAPPEAAAVEAPLEAAVAEAPPAEVAADAEPEAAAAEAEPEADVADAEPEAVVAEEPTAEEPPPGDAETALDETPTDDTTADPQPEAGGEEEQA